MDYAAALTEVADDLLEYGDYSTGTDSYLWRAMYDAAQDINERHQWDHQIGNTTITTTSENLGPYDFPADYDGFPTPERLSKAYTYDGHSVPIIPDGDYQKMYDVYRLRATGKLYFWLNPGAATYTLYYIKSFTVLTALSDWPEKLRKALKAGTKYYALDNSADTEKDAQKFSAKFEKAMLKTWIQERRGHSLQQVRDPRDIYGDQYHHSFNRWA